MIEQAERALKLKELEEEVQARWREEKIYEKTKSSLSGGKKYYFLDGPPYASGSIHLGTAWNKVMKDAIVRYLSMKGFNVRRQAGWDCHGLPIEVKVEGKLGIKTKREIEERGVERFIEECKKWAYEHVEIMTKQFARLGVWMDWDAPYMTLKNEYMEAAWWTLKRAHEKNLLSKDLRAVTWCPRCETALAEAEIEYEDRGDPSIYVKFPVVGRENECLLVWTTTPWTLVGNLGVMVSPDFEYARARTDEGILILAKEMLHVLDELGVDYKVIETVKGRTLDGLKYRNPLGDLIKVAPKEGRAYTVLLSEFVALDEGTGCVHTAPGHGPEDFEVGMRYGLRPLCPVDERGLFTAEAGKYAGLRVKKDDDAIIEDLKDRGALLHVGKVSHRYGHCWRCKTPIIYRATEQWFIQISKLKEEMLAEIDKVEWVPEWAGSARFKDWVANARDWTVSRQRYWGIPLPIWICGKCGKREVIGSKAELEERGAHIDDLHKPFVDNVILKCPCGGQMRRVPDVFDVWFDSGVASWASLNYPASKKEFETWFPCDFITEGHDQTRGWFYSQLGCGLVAFDSIPYRRVLMHGFTLDEKGRKMSKSLGNVVGPDEVIEKFGADVLRFYVLWSNKPWDDLRFSWEEVQVVNRMFNVLWNSYVFATTYMAIDGFDPRKVPKGIEKHYRKEDRWMLSRLNALVKEVTDSFESLYIQDAPRAINTFILEDLSRWYIPLVRPRTWIEKDDPDKLAAYSVLYETLTKLALVLSPIAPHVTERMHQNLVRSLGMGRESVHMESWPKADKKLMDKRLEAHMAVAKAFVEAAGFAREKKGLKRRWPVKAVLFKPKGKDAGAAVEGLDDLIKAQTNCREIVLLSARKKAPSDEERYSSAEFEYGALYLDTQRDEELISQGLARELVRRIQQMRKEQDLDVEAFIEANVQVGEEAAKLLETQRDYVARETRAKVLNIGEAARHKGYKKEWKVEDEEFVISIEVLE